MARDLDEMEDDNPIDEDFEDNGSHCLYCGELVPVHKDFCNKNCERNYKAEFENGD